MLKLLLRFKPFRKPCVDLHMPLLYMKNGHVYLGIF